jgi:hypothetical protein
LLGAGSISDLKPVSSSPGAFLRLLVASSRPFLALCFGSSAVPEPQGPAFSEVRLASLQAQAWLLASVQAWLLASVRGAAEVV